MGFALVSLFAAALLAAAPAMALDVTKFGARPNDGVDDTAAFLATFAALKDAPEKRVVIPAGVYNLRADGNPASPSLLFPINAVDGLVIDGRGAELNITGIGAIFGIANCKNPTVRGITVDWKRAPFSQGMVIASTPRTFDVKVEDAYPVKGGEPVGAFMSYYPDTRMPDGHDFDVYNGVDRTELVAAQVLRLHLKWDIKVPPGTLLVLRHYVYGLNPFSFHRCSNVKCSDLTIYTCPGMALIGIVCTDVSLKRVNVINRPGTGRMMSATADATHFGGCKGTVSYEDCTFEGMGDDGANVKSGLYLSVRKVVDDHTVLGQHNLKMVDMPDPGDTMEMARVDTLSAYASGKVKSVSLEGGTENLHRVTFEGPLPAELREGDVLGNASRVPKLRMRNVTVRGNRARGVLCQTRDALIEKCRFLGTSGAGVMVLTESVYFFESIGTRNVTVRDCLFKGCNRGAAGAEGAAVALAYLKEFAYPKTPGVHRDVTFEGNRFEDTPESAIFAVAVDGLVVRNNVVEHACRVAARATSEAAIRVMDCARVQLSGNRIPRDLQGPKMKEPELVTGTVR